MTQTRAEKSVARLSRWHEALLLGVGRDRSDQARIDLVISELAEALREEVRGEGDELADAFAKIGAESRAAVLEEIAHRLRRK